MISVKKKVFCIVLAFITGATCLTVSALSNVMAVDAGEKNTETDRGGSLPYKNGEILVEYRDKPGSGEIAAVKNIGADISFPGAETGSDILESVALVTLPDGMSVKEALDLFSKDPAVEAVQPNYIYSASSAGGNGGIGADAGGRSPVPLLSDTTAYDQWNLDKIDATEAWDLIEELKTEGTTSGSPVTIGFLDTGVDMDHDELSPLIVKDLCVDVTSDPVDGAYPPMEEEIYGHGTQVCGVAAALNDGKGVSGVASGYDNDMVRLVVANIYDDYDPNNSTNRGASTDSLLRGIAYMSGEKVRAPIINISLSLKYIGESDAFLNNAVSRAWDNGSIIVCSAGNQRTSDPRYPGSSRQAVSVMSTSNYSNAWSNCASSFSNYANNRKISAPGSRLCSTTVGNTYATTHGTSFSSATVSGVMAMMLYVDPDLTPYKLRKYIYDTATDLYIDGFDKRTGYGNVNAYRAVAMAAGKKVSVNSRISRPVVKVKSLMKKRTTVSWSASEYANSYEIYRSASKNGKYRRIASVKGTSEKYVDKGLSSGKRYYYKVLVKGTRDDQKVKSLKSKAAYAKVK